MGILKIFVAGAILSRVIFLLGPILCGLALLIWALRRRKPLAALPAVILMALPFALYHASVFHAEKRLKDRLAQVAALERHPLPHDYPRTLFVRGDLAKPTAAVLLLLGYFDNIAVYHGFSDPNLYHYTANHTPECISDAKQALRKQLDSYRHLVGCVTITSGPFVLPTDAVVLRIDHEAKNAPKKIWSNGVAEVSLTQAGHEVLIDYQERPNFKQPNGIFNPLPKSMDIGENPDVLRMLTGLIDGQETTPYAR